MATSFDELVRELATFRNSREITRACAKGIRRAVTPARQAIRRTALDTLPHAGGLGL